MVVGNDIVDLGLVRQNPKAENPKFLRKVLTESEYQNVIQSKDIELSLWIHWALKESAYKADFQGNQKRYFAPKKLVCELLTNDNNQLSAKVTTPFYEYQGLITTTKDYIHAITIPLSTTFETILYRVVQVPISLKPSESIRKDLQDYLIETYPITERDISIQKVNSIPLLTIQNKYYPLSFSHHGKWGGWAIKKPSATKQMTQIF